jgi:hypothetical protein
MNKEQVLGILRHVLTFVGGIVIAKGLVDESLYTELVGGVMTLVGTVWSIVSKKSVV